MAHRPELNEKARLDGGPSRVEKSGRKRRQENGKENPLA